MKFSLTVLIFISTISLVKSQSTLNLGLLSPQEQKVMFLQKWFYQKYERFAPDTLILNSVTDRLRNCQIDILIGDWCPDTKFYLPRFLKLFHELNINEENIMMYNVDRKKKRPKKYVRKFGISYLPTIIFSDDNGEIGRIVEFPNDTVEKDILNILLPNNGG